MTDCWMSDEHPSVQCARAAEDTEDALEATYKLRSIARRFQEGFFPKVLSKFVADRAAKFAFLCTDDSHPLEWTEYHRDYCELYETHLIETLRSLCIAEDEFERMIVWLHQNANEFDGDADDVTFEFFEALTSSVDYHDFLKLMFAEVRKQQRLWEEAGEDGCDEADLAVPACQEVVLTVPNYAAPGQVIDVEYLGIQQKVSIPEGCEPGMQLLATVASAPIVESVRSCSYCQKPADAVFQFMKCKRCYERCARDVCYCGTECQIADWPQHKRLCGKRKYAALA